MAQDRPELRCHGVQMRGMSSALSAASSACDHMRDWIHGTPSGTFVSMGVFSDGSYNAPKVTTRNLWDQCDQCEFPQLFSMKA